MYSLYWYVFMLFIHVYKCATVKHSRKYQASSLSFTLVGKNGENEGYLAINEQYGWNLMCDTYWGVQNSKVVCRELGYRKHLKTVSKKPSGISTVPLHFSNRDITCESNEHYLGDCKEGDYISDRHLERYCKQESYVYIICDPKKESDVLETEDKFQLRLMNGDVQYGEISSGFLQISMQKNGWKNTCADEWTLENGNVACKNLGFSSVKKYYGTVYNKVDPEYLYKEFLCTGNEFLCTGNETTLWQCQHEKHQLCRSNELVYLECGRPDKDVIVTEKNGEIRLRGGAVESEGRVEIFDGDQWGTICDDEWDIKDANVVCHQLGFGSAYEATHWSDNGEGLGKIQATEVQCFGSENNLKECGYSTKTDSCTHREDAGVRCRKPQIHHKQDIKLVGGKNKNEGRIEFIDAEGLWRGICGIGFAKTEGEVACRQLGLGFVKWSGRSYKYGINYKKRMFNVQCKGNETELSQCTFKNWGRCRYYDMASVICSKYAADLVMDIDMFKESILVESHPLHHLRCSFEEKCLAPIVDDLYKRHTWTERRLLKFTSRFINKGAVSFRPHVEKDSWLWHSCHKHYHSMETFAIYDLINKDGLRVAHGHKASFCLEDSDCEAGYKKTYNCTDKGDQGITVNCADNYSNRIDCQWIDISEVPYGNYSLRVEANPLRNVSESDWLNNKAVCEIGYFDKEVEVRGCTTDPCYQESFGGNSYGHCCKFPFKYNGTLQYTCIHNNKEDKQWCATTHDFDQDQKWGYCQEVIPEGQLSEEIKNP